jgi:hypothetical protein
MVWVWGAAARMLNNGSEALVRATRRCRIAIDRAAPIAIASGRGWRTEFPLGGHCGRIGAGTAASSKGRAGGRGAEAVRGRSIVGILAMGSGSGGGRKVGDCAMMARGAVFERGGIGKHGANPRAFSIIWAVLCFGVWELARAGAAMWDSVQLGVSFGCAAPSKRELSLCKAWAEQRNGTRPSLAGYPTGQVTTMRPGFSVQEKNNKRYVTELVDRDESDDA